MCVLLVEDEALIREIMSESLQDAGFEVMQAGSGDEAVCLIHAEATRFHALVTDFHMPGGTDGAGVASCIRQHLPRIPVIIASGRPEVFQSAWRTSLGYWLLRKPYGPGELVGIVSRMLGESAAHSSA